MPDTIDVVMMTHAGGAHVGAYLSALASSPECRSVILCDPDGTFVEEARTRLKDKLARVEKSFETGLKDTTARMALVSMEAAKAPPVIEQALQAGLHVFAEKPSCTRLEEFTALRKTADAKHLHLMLAFANRLNPPNLEAKRLIQSGRIGSLYGTEMILVADQTRLKSPAYHKNWFASKARAGGGNLLWLGVHYVDLAMYLTGQRITEVAGFAGNVGGQPIDIEDSAAVAFRFENGSFGTLTSGYYLDRGYQSGIRFWGSHGWIQMTPSGPGPATLESYSTKDAEPKPTKYTGPLEPSGYGPCVHAAVRAAAGLAEPPVTSEESERALRAVFGFYEAARTGQTQKL